MNLGCASVLRCMVDVMHMQKKRTALWAALGYFESSKMCIDDTCVGRKVEGPVVRRRGTLSVVRRPRRRACAFRVE